MAKITVIDHSDEFMLMLAAACRDGLERCGMTAEGYAKDLCIVNTGALRNSITHLVADHDVYVGTNMHYGPYVECGTGVHYSGGRKTPWVYQDEWGMWHQTKGMKAHPYLKPAIADHIEDYKKILESALKGE